MEYEVARDHEVIGTYTHDELQALFKDGTLRLNDAVRDPHTGQWMELSVLLAFAPDALGHGSGGGSGASAAAPEVSEERAGVIISRLARYERVSAVVWLIIAIVQIVCVVTALAGLWNIYAVITRFKMARSIESCHPGVPDAYERGLTWIIVMVVINLSLGGIFAAGWCGFDYYVRSRVLKYRHLFERQEGGTRGHGTLA